MGLFGLFASSSHHHLHPITILILILILIFAGSILPVSRILFASRGARVRQPKGRAPNPYPCKCHPPAAAPPR